MPYSRPSTITVAPAGSDRISSRPSTATGTTGSGFAGASVAAGDCSVFGGAGTVPSVNSRPAGAGGAGADWTDGPARTAAPGRDCGRGFAVSAPGSPCVLNPYP